MTATIHQITPRRAAHPFRAPAPITHGTRDPARLAPPSGRAVDFDRHRPLCQTCRLSPCVCDVGTMGGTWIADQVERANAQACPAPRTDDRLTRAETALVFLEYVAAAALIFTVAVIAGQIVTRWWLGL